MHDHPAPEKLGTVSFPLTCSAAVQQPFNRAVSLLHSFAYTEARYAFHHVAQLDPQCAMAYWGVAISYYHPLWEGLAPSAVVPGQAAIQQAIQLHSGSPRELEFIRALSIIYTDGLPFGTRTLRYEHAMSTLAQGNPADVESQVFYALALLAVSPPTDKSHANQKQAMFILEPLYRTHPDHPGLAHYIIHACDNREMAQQGLAAARAYAQVAPSAPHALHMPSHIFTRLGLWQDSITSNIAARDAARRQGDLGEQLHAMDYLVYAYLQTGQNEQAADVIHQLQSELNTPSLDTQNFKIGYAATAMPIRYDIELHHWTDAAAIIPPSAAPPSVAAIAVWARGLGLARSGHPNAAREQIVRLRELEAKLRSAGDDYWATQTSILTRELEAWCAQAEHDSTEAESLLRSAASEEDAVEKLPVTPGPILPAREQLGSVLLEQNHPALALEAFQAALQTTPGRRSALQGAADAARLSSDRKQVTK